MMRFLFIATVALVGSACGSGGGSDAGLAITCQNDPRVMTYAPGLAATAAIDGGIAVKIVLETANPTPPARYTNDWTIYVTDGAGNALSGEAITVLPYMPDHGHGSSIAPAVTPQSSGVYKIDNLYFFMPGVWRTTVTVPAAGQNSDVAFWFCIPG